MRRLIATLALAFVFLPTAAQAQGTNIPAEDILVLELDNGGTVLIEMFPDVAPEHVQRISGLANQGFYDGVIFHRVIPGFMAQGGDPTGTGRGGSDLPNLPAEFSSIPHRRGIASMARASSPNSANSQFFIMFADEPESGGTWSQLDGQYTVWGRVITGMEHVDNINEGQPPETPTSIVEARTYDVVNPGVETVPGPPPIPERETFARERTQLFDPLFDEDVEIDILSPVLANPNGG